MGKEITTTINKFGSMTPRLRDNTFDFALACHFNTFRHGSLSPNVGYLTFTDGGEKVVKFVYARGIEGSTVSYYVYGLGDSSGHPAIFRGPVGGYSGTPSWTTIATAVGTKAKANILFEYKDCLYGWQGDTPTSDGEIWTVPNLENDTTPNLATFQPINFTNVAQPVHHKADDYAYFFYDNKVCRHTGATDSTVWSADVLTLPTNMKIIGGASYGNFLAIVCSPLQLGATNSVMYLWDRDSSLTTLTAKIDLGMGEAVHCSEAEDGGVWITQSTVGVSGTTARNNSISIKYYNGSLYSLDFPCGMPVDYFQSITLTGNAWEERNVFYFPAKIVTQKNGTAGDTRNVIFAARMNGGIELVADQEITGVTQSINGILSVGGIWFVSYDTAAQSLAAKVSAGFQTGTYESKIFDEGDSSQVKKLIGVTLMTSDLPSAATTSLYYRKDEETAWTLIFTHDATTAGSFIVGNKYKITSAGTTDFTLIGATDSNVDTVFTATGVGTGTGTAIDDLMSHSAINIESTGVTLPEYKEIQFKILSTGGAEIIALKYLTEILGKDLY